MENSKIQNLAIEENKIFRVDFEKNNYGTLMIKFCKIVNMFYVRKFKDGRTTEFQFHPDFKTTKAWLIDSLCDCHTVYNKK